MKQKTANAPEQSDYIKLAFIDLLLPLTQEFLKHFFSVNVSLRLRAEFRVPLSLVTYLFLFLDIHVTACEKHITNFSFDAGTKISEQNTTTIFRVEVTSNTALYP